MNACPRCQKAPCGCRPSEELPYRSAATRPREAADIRCPYCGNASPPLAQTCPHCDVRLDAARCKGCYAFVVPGDYACTKCGKAVEIEPLLDAADAPCPRCRVPLAMTAAWTGDDGGEARLHECPRCRGLFVAHGALAEILSRAEQPGARDGIREDAAPRREAEAVTYLPCPQCHATMNRKNFGRSSGVIVDVCKAHGTWFDPGELTRVIAFVSGGGLQRAARADSARPSSLPSSSAEVPLADARAEAGRLDLTVSFVIDVIAAFLTP